MKPYYQDDLITLWWADCLEIPESWTGADVLVTDPPYGMGYRSGWNTTVDTIAGDNDTTLRDEAIDLWGTGRDALVFGRWNIHPPAGEKQRLIWHKASTAGMGDLNQPWGTNYEVIHRLGTGWSRKSARVKRRGAVITTHETRGGVMGDEARYRHPTPKPVPLMEKLIECIPQNRVIADPFAGTGATLRAAKNMGRRAIGVELREEYCEVITERLRQETLWA